MNFNEWKQLAEEGKAEAQYNLGLLYSLGKEIPKNNSEAIKWYQRSRTGVCRSSNQPWFNVWERSGSRTKF